jgi:hypothetical protein
MLATPELLQITLRHALTLSSGQRVTAASLHPTDRAQESIKPDERLPNEIVLRWQVPAGKEREFLLGFSRVQFLEHSCALTAEGIAWCSGQHALIRWSDGGYARLIPLTITSCAAPSSTSGMSCPWSGRPSSVTSVPVSPSLPGSCTTMV